MTWDKTLPGDHVKLREIGTTIRPHWDAIELADEDTGIKLNVRSVQFCDRCVIATADDPTTVAGTHFIYSKQDGGGIQELYSRDSAGNILQLTSAGKIGNTTSNYVIDTISFDGTRTYNENNIVTAWGYVNSAGVLQYGDGVASTARTAQGNYTIDFTAGRLTTTDYAIVAMAEIADATWMGTKTVAQCTITVRTVNSGSNVDRAFFFIVVGGQ